MLKKTTDNSVRLDSRKKPKKLRRIVIRWHRRLGLVSALFVLVLALTGLMLNRTVEWQLDERLVKAHWIASWYDLGAKSKPIGYKAGAHWVAVLDEQLYIDGRYVGLRDGAIFGAVPRDGGIVIGGEVGLIAYSQEGQLFDQITNDELPGKITRIGRMSDGALAISTNQGIFVARKDLRQWIPEGGDPEWSRRGVLPPDISRVVIEAYNGRGMPVSRILLDLHSGRFFGNWGTYVMDAAAIFLMLLALSGFYNWWVRRN